MPARPEQKISFCRAADGVRLAYATVGQGPFLVKTGGFLGHLELDWKNWGHIWATLANDRTLLRYDARGNGLSDWDAGEISLDAWVRDLETVVDAAGIDRFPLVGFSQGCAVSVAYAARHPDRVSHLILYGGFALGVLKRAISRNARDRLLALRTLMRTEWDTDNPSFRQMMTAQFMPEASKEQVEAFNELLRNVCTPDCAIRYYGATDQMDVRDLLAKISVPTLVMHAREDGVQPVEEGRKLAAGIPGARFVTFPGKNHIFTEDEPAAARFNEEIELFLRG
jgi:pimeloyl-ACP methyl ester carboxylesterase